MTTPAGWYPDNAGATRYWDGTAWTAATAPTPQADGRRFTIHYGFALLAVFSLLGTLGPVLLFAIGAAGDPDARGGVPIVFMWFLWGGFWTLIWSAFAINHTLKSRR